MTKRVKLGIGSFYKKRSGVIYLVRGHVAALKGRLVKYEDVLTARELSLITKAVAHLDEVIASAHQEYETIMKPRFIKQANESRPQSPAGDSNEGLKDAGPENTQPDTGPGQESTG